MRSLPSGWPAADDYAQTVPTVYLHVLDSSWPPASDDGEFPCPTGWAECGSWSLDWDLSAPLMPGQVSAQVNPTFAEGECTIPHPAGALLAPWRVGDERTPKASKVELVASHDGPLGSTAFLLGQFILDPMRGRMSEPFITLRLVQDLVRLKKPHDLPPSINAGVTNPLSPTRYLEAGAENNGLALSATADFESDVTSSYFKGTTDELTAMQSIVTANLGAMFLSLDGTTIRVLDPDYLLGGGTVLETISVLDALEDVSWSQDPNAAVDRIEVLFLRPSYDDDPMGPAPYDGAVVWRAPRGAKLSAGESVTYTFDPGRYISINTVGNGDSSTMVYGNTTKDGSGSDVDLPAEIERFSSGSYAVTIKNNTGGTKYLVAPYRPGGGTTDYPKRTRSFLAGTLDGAEASESGSTETWGKSSSEATNTLTFDVGSNIQQRLDARAILNRIVTRVTSPSYVLDDVRVVPNLGREIADLYRLDYPEAGLNTRAMVTGIKMSGAPGEIQQSLSLAVIPLTIDDFNKAWAALPGDPTIGDFNDVWAGKTAADFDIAPLKTSP